MQQVIAEHINAVVQYTNGDRFYHLVGCTVGEDGQPETLSLLYPETRQQRPCSAAEKTFILQQLPHPHYYHVRKRGAAWWQMYVRSLPPEVAAGVLPPPDKPVTDAVASTVQ